MKKKLLLGAAILVGLGTTLTSCVDSYESATVTNIRNAKAEQLKSIADFNKAQAEAALIIANAQNAAQAANQAYQEAQAALIAAQAEQERAEADLKRAQADYWKAQAAYLSAQTDAEKAKLQAELDKLAQEVEALRLKNEMAKAELEKAQDEVAYNKKKLEYDLAQLEIALKTAGVLLDQEKVNLDKAIQEYENMVTEAANKADDRAKQAAADKVAEVEMLKWKYKKASKSYFDAKKDLAYEEANLLKLKSNLENAETVKANIIAEKKQTQAKEQATLLADQDLLTFYQKYAGEKVTPEVVAAAIDNEKTAQENSDKANEAVDAAKEAFDTATAALDDSEFKKLVNKTIWNSENAGSNYNTTTWSYWVENNDGEVDYMTCQIVYIPSTEENDGYNNPVPTDCRGKWVVKTGKTVYDRSYNIVENAVYTYTPIYEEPKYEVVKEVPVTEVWELVEDDAKINIQYYVTQNFFDDMGNWIGSQNNWNAISVNTETHYVNIWGNNPDGDYYDIYGNHGWMNAQLYIKKLQELEISYVEQSYYTPIEAGLNAWKAWRDAQIKANPQNIKELTATITEANGYVTDAEAIYAKYSDLFDAEEALGDAQTAQANLPADATDAQKEAAQTAVETAQGEVTKINTEIAKEDFQKKVNALIKYINYTSITNKAEALSALHAVRNILNNANNALLVAQNNEANADFKVSKVDELVSNILEQAPEGEKLVDAVNKAAEAKASAELAATIANGALQNAQAEMTTINNAYQTNTLIGGNSIFNDWIKTLEGEIETLEKNIAARETSIAGLEEELKNFNNTAVTEYGELYKVAIAKQEAEVEKCKEYVSMYEYLYNLAKAALEAALKGDSATETPAE